MTVELITKLLATAEAHFGKPQTEESRASIAEIWAKSPIANAPDDIAEKAFFDAIWKCTWQSQLLKEWQAAIEKAEGKREMTRRCLVAHTRMQRMKNIEYLYKSYHALGGNGTGTELYTRAKSLPLHAD